MGGAPARPRAASNGRAEVVRWRRGVATAKGLRRSNLGVTRPRRQRDTTSRYTASRDGFFQMNDCRVDPFCPYLEGWLPSSGGPPPLVGEWGAMCAPAKMEY